MAHDVLIVDDEADIRLMITGLLEDEGYTCRTAGDSDSALEAIRARIPSLVMLDIWLQNSTMDGLDLLQVIRRDHPYLPIVMISGHGTIENAVWAIKHGAYDFIEKPFKTDRILLCVERAIENAALKRENEELRLRAGRDADLIGRSTHVQQLRHNIQKVAPTGSRVLITGPAGAGKEVAARLLHSESRRAQGPFVVLNCAIMHPDRLESELFGVESDSSGENGDGAKIGTFERAHGGTLVLDEVSDMPLETQGKIVRVLQDQSFIRVGGSKRVEVDVRVIASSNRDLQRLISEGRFREDLYYRLNVVPLTVPALSDRREDIPELVEHFVAYAAKSAGLPPRQLSEDALAALQSYGWPGNVRQLRNVIDWLLIMAPGEADEPIRADMLPSEIVSAAPTALNANGHAEIMSLPLREARELFERQYLEAQVTRFGGNISRTAAFVGMERSALHRKLRSLGISSSADRQ
ncbi:sigma-54-dependent transcriptional regulator [Ferruginivarius sediminum]|uniref:Sigma-54-dependent Fis family transcriptional regulator n=1 Tax=Ferruginivarius sediminum TaxID=2661937 RepID=A0A369TC46_9PROT|nr:sigma-54 dependent transcriptional regulator [Ferruginivarius sediminum]RDD62094.1 sigma-54-dependent Fis family transcriptional regulator [Ferruginivarius sediminum]